MTSSTTFERVKHAIEARAVHVSLHAGDEAVQDGLLLDDIEAATLDGECMEEYPDDPRGPSCLVLGTTGGLTPVHALWGFDAQRDRAILITVYHPDPQRWSADFRTRRRKHGIEPE